MLRNVLLLGLSFLTTTFAFAESGVSALLNDWRTIFFLLVNLFLTYYFAFRRFDRFAVVHGPEILTTVGIFGCFFGIAFALLEFNTSDVQTSVPKLLEGVKTAFWASVSGVGGALVIRARHKFQKAPLAQPEGVPKSSSLDDVVIALNGVRQSLTGGDEESLISQIKLMRQDQNDNHKALKAQMFGDENSLISQVKMMRQDQNDNQQTLIAKFEEFAKKMAEDGSKALIEALREVIADFNAQINDQFGENFKHLNAAVEKLVVWQQQYKEELDRIQQLQTETTEGLNEASRKLGEMVSNSEKFTQAAALLVNLLTALKTQHDQIKNAQAELANVLSSLKNVTPEFAKNIDLLIENINQGVKKVHDQMLHSATEFAGSTKIASEGLANRLGESLVGFGEHAKVANDNLVKQLSDGMLKSQSKIDSQLESNLERIKKAYVDLDESLQSELNRSLQSLGNQLASLSKKFVEDYDPLTEKLREVVQLAKNLDQKNAS